MFKRNWKNKIASIILVVAIAFVTVLQPVSAERNSINQSQLSDSIAAFEESTREVSEQERNEYLLKAQEKIENENIELNTPDTSEINYENGKVMLLNDEFYYVSLNYQDEELHEFSGLSVTFDKTGEVVQYYETQLYQLSENSGTVQSWLNGDLIVDETISVEESKNYDDGIVSPLSFSEFNDCLSSQGVSSWAIAVLSIACGAICAGTAGVGCAPCLYAASSIAGGTIGWCIGQAWG